MVAATQWSPPDVATSVRTIDPDLPLVNVRIMTEIVRERLASDRLNVGLLVNRSLGTKQCDQSVADTMR
jgi:hypothetical protein